MATVLSAQTTDENRWRRSSSRSTPAPPSWRRRTPKTWSDHLLHRVLPAEDEVDHRLPPLVEEMSDGVVPDTIEELVKLPGVGRKTASVLLAEAWNKPAIAVDTHVKRVAGRLELTHNTDPDKIEQDLKALFPTEEWAGISMRFIQFGRDVCTARNPKCGSCELRLYCPWPDKQA